MEDKRITKAMKASDHEDVILEEDEDYERGNVSLSFHHQAKIPISRKALLADFLSAWLKRCVIPSRPHDGITPLVVFLAVQFVYGRSLGLLLAIVCHIQSGLHALTEQFYAKATVKRAGKELVLSLIHI